MNLRGPRTTGTSLVTASVLLVAWCLSSVAVAQQTGGSGGLFGNRNIGSSISAGSRSFSGGTGGGTTTDASADAGQVTGNERFVRESRQAGQFVGGDSQDAQNFFSILNNQAISQALRPSGNQGPPGRGNQSSRGGSQGVTVRATLKVGFNYRRPPARAISANLSQRLNQSKWIRSLSPLEVRVTGRTATLRGTVATARDRVLAEQLALLEAGISRVENELTVLSPNESKAPSEQP